MVLKLRAHQRLGAKPALSWLQLRDKFFEFINLVGLLGQGLAFMLSYEGVAMACVTIVSIFLVSRQVLDVTFHVEFAIFSAGCIFPLTFNVSSAFKRRDEAIEQLARLKSNLIAIHLNFALFDLEGSGAAQRDVEPALRNLVSNVETCLRGPRHILAEERGTVALKGKRGRGAVHELAAHAVYDDFARLAQVLQKHTHTSFGFGGMETAVSTSTERTWQFLQDAVVAYEGVKAIRFSATSVGLRYFSYALINLSCFMLAPFWASYCRDETFGARQSGGLSDELGLGPGAGAEVWQVEELGYGYGCTSAYLVGLFFTFIVFTLYRVQKDLDDPFLGTAQDDIRWSMWREELGALGKHGLMGPEIRADPAEIR